MSYVTGVIVVFHMLDADKIDRLNEWFDSHNRSKLVVDHQHASGGDKHPQFYTASGGYNYLEHESLVLAFKALEFECEESALLVISEEDHPVIAIKPS